ncbi:MAG TPA: DUF4126 domain-containing protein [Blastocatellia bacterium]|nr:DUF4126 domain-containing protein [Blastocatellia bacterium]
MNIISLLGTSMGSAWLSGLNLYATVAILGLLSRYGGLQLPGDLNVLTNKWVIIAAVSMYVVEFFADKIPYLDSVWDVLHTFIRIPAGAVLAAGAFGNYSKEVQVIALMVGGGLAFTSHSSKAATRAVINLSPEPVTNWIASFTEDAIAIGGTFLMVYAPFIMLIFLAIFVLIFLLVLPKIIRGIKRLFTSVRNWFKKKPLNQPMPKTT